ncbi:MAG: sulfatase-like hydrolase/transferase, partial [Actinomycetota bacterium]|nr:sulfatase-like hydrolase/transferase [Actinomycetota bacterium]
MRSGAPGRALWGCALALAAMAAIGCGSGRDEVLAPAEPVTAPDDGSNTTEAETRPTPQLVLLVSIDTLRADHLGVYGYERFTSPTLDVFAAEGTVFEDASATAPWTLPSHATMLTGLFPMSHQVMTFSTSLDPSRTTLPAMLAADGWQTAAAVSTGWLRRERYNL